ncbi:MAG: ATP-binding protein [Lachnospiraceae bacterium]|nr:ATP-binding protein [Lachnospiraceae bacterium]
MRKKIKNNEVDGVLSSETPDWPKEGATAVISFGGSLDYFAISKKCPDLKEELDAAMQKMKVDRPFYEDDLYKKYLSSESVEVVSGEEADWLDEHGKIRIGYLNDDQGISVYDPVSQKVNGVIQDYVSYAKNCLQNAQLDFELIGYDSREEQLQALQDDQIDMIFHISQNPSAAEQNGYILSDTVWTFNFAAITSKDHFDENEENVVAVQSDNIALKQYIAYCYPDWTIMECDSVEKAEQAVKNEQADCMVVRSSQVVKYIGDRKLHSIFLTQPGNASFAVKRTDTALLSILNKTLKATESTGFTSAVVAYDYSSERTTFNEFVKDNLVIVTSAFAGIFLVILLIVLAFLRKANHATVKAEELNKELEEKQKELEHALTQAESANAAKTTFLNNMSHDIRTPINGIIGMLMIIRKSGNDPERVKECLDKIDTSSKLLLSLVNDVLDMAKLETETIIVDNESINLDQVCEEVTTSLSFQAEAEGMNIIAEHDDYTGVNVWSNALYLKKILMNLFSNSMKYNKANGEIHMSMRTLEQSEDRITCEFQIRDTGVGMSEEFIQHDLFTPFVQADKSARSNYAGTGLGMPIVKQLVDKMGGTIKVESKLGEGSCFTVVIPFRLDHQTKHEERKEDVHGDISGLRILLVEDNELNMEIADFILKDCGASVDHALNGQEAVRKFEAAKEGTYDVILMDIMMPVMDGLIATKTIRALAHSDAKTIPIIAMTANAFKEDAERCMKAGMNAHVAKPLDKDKILHAICDNIQR